MARPCEAAAPPPPPDDRIRGGYGAPPPPSYGPGYVTGKSPAVALILSMLIPGVGQLYNGDTKKGIIMLVIHFASFFGWFSTNRISKADGLRS